LLVSPSRLACCAGAAGLRADAAAGAAMHTLLVLLKLVCLAGVSHTGVAPTARAATCCAASGPLRYAGRDTAPPAGLPWQSMPGSVASEPDDLSVSPPLLLLGLSLAPS
jgi:hypothetical protein